MRRFYIFNISREFYILNKNDSYNLYKTLSYLYHNKTNKYLIDLYKRITYPFDRINISNDIYNYYISDSSYTKFLNNHLYNNYYSLESTKLSIGNNYMLIDTNISNPIFFKLLKNIKGLFVCDFMNIDYFWLDNIA